MQTNKQINKKSRCFIAKDKGERERLQHSTAAQQCMNLNEVLQQKRKENAERNTARKKKKKVYSKYTASIKVNCICMLHANPQGISAHTYSQIL